MKYRRLTKEELIPLEKEFIHYLSANQITADDWEEFKKVDPDGANKLLDLFSDVVFDKILDDVHYIEVKDNKGIKVFRFTDEVAEMIGIRFDVENYPNLSTLTELLNQINSEKIPVQLVVAEKKLDESRNQEKFALLQSGGVILKDSAAFDQLAKIKNENLKS